MSKKSELTVLTKEQQERLEAILHENSPMYTGYMLFIISERDMTVTGNTNSHELFNMLHNILDMMFDNFSADMVNMGIFKIMEALEKKYAIQSSKALH